MVIRLPWWLRQLRRREIVSVVDNDARSKSGSLLGVSAESAREAAGWGQADFDEPWGGLSCDDRVLLYSYFFQLGHLEELIAAFRQLFEEVGPKEPIFVDLGCGPFTGGLAIASEFERGEPVDYIGVDRSRAMCRFGEQLASAADKSEEIPEIRRHWFKDVSSVHWDAAPGWRPVIVVASYLLASPTLDVRQVVAELLQLLCRLGSGPVTVLYTNSRLPGPNRNFDGFSNALTTGGFELIRHDDGELQVERLGRLTPRNLRYALFHRREQGTLRLEQE